MKEYGTAKKDSGQAGMTFLDSSQLAAGNSLNL